MIVCPRHVKLFMEAALPEFDYIVKPEMPWLEPIGLRVRVYPKGAAVDDGGRTEIAHFGLQHLAFVQIIYSFGSFVRHNHRRGGIGDKLLDAREYLADHIGDALLACVRNDNEVEKRMLERRGWEKATFPTITKIAYDSDLWLRAPVHRKKYLDVNFD